MVGPVGFHVVLARELLFANVAPELRRQIAARQLVAFQVAVSLEKLQTFRVAVPGPDAALFGQMKAQMRLALVVPSAVRAQPSAA